MLELVNSVRRRLNTEQRRGHLGESKCIPSFVVHPFIGGESQWKSRSDITDFRTCCTFLWRNSSLTRGSLGMSTKTTQLPLLFNSATELLSCVAATFSSRTSSADNGTASLANTRPRAAVCKLGFASEDPMAVSFDQLYQNTKGSVFGLEHRKLLAKPHHLRSRS